MATPVSRLQEHFAKSHEILPTYFIENVGTAKFKCTVNFGKNRELEAVGYGSTKQEAKHESALQALKMCLPSSSNLILNFRIEELVNSKNTIMKPVLNDTVINYVGKLNEHASIHGYLYPSYKEVSTSISNFCTECNFQKLRTQGNGNKKKEAKQDAARKMLSLLMKTKSDINNIGITINSSFKQKIDTDPLTLTNDTDALKKFLDLQKNISELYITEKPYKVDSTSDMKVVKITPKLTTEKELKTEMDKLGISYRLETIRMIPYILSIRTSSGRVVFGGGDTKELALNDVAMQILDMAQNGFKL